MAVEYAYDDALGFCTEYLQDFEHTSRRMWDVEEEDRDTKEVLEGVSKDIVFTDAELYSIHDFVIHNEECTVDLLDTKSGGEVELHSGTRIRCFQA